MLPRISIVMPVYNAEEYLREAINSVLNQSFEDFELIIINDNSTDGSVDTITKYNDRRIVLINNKHDFINSLNKGMTAAKGEYIARMDADDVMVSNRLEIQVHYLEEHSEVDICGGWMKTFGDHNNIIMQTYVKHDDIVLCAIRSTPLFHPTIMIRSKVVKSFPLVNDVYDVYKNDYDHAEDYKLWIDSIQKGYKLANIPEILLKYRLHINQVTQKYNAKMLITTHKIQNEYLEFLMGKIIELDEEYYVFFNQAIELCNTNKISFNDLKTIVQTVGSNLKGRF